VPATSLAAGELVGTWRLESWRVVYGDDRPPKEPMGAAPDGLLTYSPDGYVQVAISARDRAPFGTQNTHRVPVQQRAQAYVTHFGYAGRYAVEGARVVHRVALSSLPDLVGTDQWRDAALSGDVLTLSARYQPAGEPQPREHRLVWRRAVL
jgi:hypothetical protein